MNKSNVRKINISPSIFRKIQLSRKYHIGFSYYIDLTEKLNLEIGNPGRMCASPTSRQVGRPAPVTV